MEGFCQSNQSSAIAIGNRRAGKLRRHRASVHPHWRLERKRLGWDCWNSFHWYTARNVVYLLMQMKDIINRTKSRPWHSRSVATNWTKPAISSIYADVTVFHVNRNEHNVAPSGEYNLCRGAGQIPIPAHTQASYGIGQRPGRGVMIIGTHCNIAERSSMTLQSLKNNILEKPFYVSIAKLTAKLADLPQLMTFASTSNASTSVIHAKDDQL